MPDFFRSQMSYKPKPEASADCALAPGYVAGMIELQTAVTEHIIEMDKVMKGPSTYERGQRIAKLVSNLQEALTESQKPHNDQAQARDLSRPTT